VPERKAKPPLDDDDLQELIAERLDADPVFQVGRGGRARVEVEVDDGEATLHGVVLSAFDRRKADILARALGATTVDNRLRVEPEDPVTTSRHAGICTGRDRAIVARATESSGSARRTSRPKEGQQ
jgi:hypothetical protein